MLAVDSKPCARVPAPSPSRLSSSQRYAHRPTPLAHNLSRPSPVFGDGGSVFTFQGRAWQPRGTIQAQYFRRDTDSRPFRTGQFRTGRNGAFTFRLLEPWFWDTGRLERMCFAQFDTRFGRTFRKCQSFYVAPASAYFMPADGLGGQLFILVANGFEPGVTLTIEPLNHHANRRVSSVTR